MSWVVPEERAYIARIVRELRGWLTQREGEFLYALSARGPGRGAIVEIGSHRAKSTVLLARASRSAGREPVQAIDPHRSGSEADFRANLAREGLAEVVVPTVMRSQDFVASWSEPIRLLFIDGDHSYEGARSDYVDWGRHVVPGGIIALHDSFSFAGVRRLVEENILPADDVELIGVVDSITAVRKRAERTFRHRALRAARAVYCAAKSRRLPLGGGMRKASKRLLYSLSSPVTG